MKIKSSYRRPSRRLSRRNNEGLFFQQESADPSFFHSTADPQAKSDEMDSFLPKEPEEEEPAKAKEPEEEETAAKEPEEEEVAAKEEEEEAPQAKEEEEEPVQAKRESEPSAPIKAKESTGESDSGVTAHRCSRRRRSMIDSALVHAKQMTSRAIDVVSHARATAEDGSDATEKYENWFGPIDMDRSLFVLNVFRKIHQNLSSSNLQFECNCRRKIYAYVHPLDSALQIYLCRLFWSKAGTSGYNSRGGVLIHELSHEAHEQIGDHKYGMKKAKLIATPLYSSFAIRNADNYQFFAESL